MDVSGIGAIVFTDRRTHDLPPTRIWFERVPEPGHWQFVDEFRSPDGTEVVKLAYATLIVSVEVTVVLGEGGRPVEISSDMTRTSDRIHAIRYHVFVSAGATLSIEPGTPIHGSMPTAAIIGKKAGWILADGRLDAPIVMTCDQPVGPQFEGCWGGLALLGSAPTTRGVRIAEGITPASPAAYGGRDAADSGGMLRYAPVEFAGAGTDSAGPTSAKA